MSTTNKTPREHYDDWCRSGNKASLRTCILRLAWKTDQKPLPGRDNAHWADVEWVARGIETMPGRKPSWEYLQEVAQVVRGEGRSNHRPLVPERNRPASGIDRRTAEISKNGGEVRGHARAKVVHQAQWLVDNKDALPEGLVRRLGDMLHAVKDADTGKPMIDRRQLATAGRDFRVSRTEHAPTSAVEIERIAQGIASLSLEPAQLTAVATAAADGDVRFNRDGTVNRTSAAVRRRDVLVRNDGGIDGRSAMLRSAAASASASASGPRKADGTLDMRYAANRGTSASASASARASGPCKADGTPDMRYAANRGSGGGRRGGGKGRK